MTDKITLNLDDLGECAFIAVTPVFDHVVFTLGNDQYKITYNDIDAMTAQEACQLTIYISSCSCGAGMKVPECVKKYGEKL